MSALEHSVRAYDAQREGMAIVTGWMVYAQVTGVTGRKLSPVPVALCGDEIDAEEIAALLNAKYAAAGAATESV